MLYYEDFSKWVDSNLQQLPSDVIAVNFNLYEGSNQTYDIQLIGTDTFDEEDEDWVCEEIFTTGEDVFLIPRTDDIENWEDGLSFITKMIEKYLQDGKLANVLQELQGVGVGFVDGDIEILHQAK
ncbi:hypothetical protein N4T77_01645 [Clostridium sp. CX1]|uniref:Uncharacterized protein n=1 Tax=Clostridium tanneri TaxID=3037988 RepID=A0ABU4JPZ9_9CLOT|nr:MULTISPECIES: hypothetical protein [unclassified Clostridium]MCT8975293.1 hypothetical protein [Clostridium sp. CX1]MDW8800217.1 hypothetical protein [Clostridium sp. A1-XYC3]